MTAARTLSPIVKGSERNLVEMLLGRATDENGAAALYKSSAGWTEVSWAQVLEQVKSLSAAMVAWGVGPGDRVAVFASTCLQWVVTDLAISASRAVSIPIYASNTPDEVRYILQNSGSMLVFVDHDQADGRQQGRLSRLRARLGECPDVRQVVAFEGPVQGPREVALAAFLEQGRGEAAGAFEARAQALQPDDLCHFIYTSGTTGDPKGVMLTHANWTNESKAIGQMALMIHGASVMLFLPLAHSFAQATKAAWVGQGFKLVFAESIDTLVANLGETKPTILPAVPRVFEKVFSAVQSNAMTAPGLKGRLARWAFALFDEYVEAKKANRPYHSLSWTLARRLVFSKIQAGVTQRLGGQMKILISGGAPLSVKIGYFFELLGLEVLEGYGLTETSAGATINRPGKARIGTVGSAFPGCEVKIADDGEVLIRGPIVMKGYHRNEAATAEVLEADGWFHSGDIGVIDPDGNLRITDRKKDIIVTAGGKNVAPQNLENQLKGFPLISSAMVYGDQRPYLTVLICVAEDNARRLLADQGVTVGPYSALASRPEIRQAVQAVLDRLNADQPPYNTLKKFSLMDHDFTQESGDLTPTLKVKRKHCTAKYQATLDAMYDGQKLD